MAAPELRYYPLLQPPRYFTLADAIQEVGPHRRLLGHDSDPWLTWALAYVDTTHVAYAPEPLALMTPELVEQNGLAQLRALPGRWERIPDDEVRDPALSPVLSWESEDPYGAERILDDTALRAAAAQLDAHRLYVLIPARKICYVRPMTLPLDGDHRFEASRMMQWMWPIHQAAATPLSMHVWMWDEARGLCGALRSSL